MANLKKKITKIFSAKEPPYLLIILISAFVWIFNSWVNNIGSEPRVTYQAKYKSVDEKKLFYYEIINISRVSFKDLHFSIGFENKDSLKLINGIVNLEPPYYQQNAGADCETKIWANFIINTLQPKSKCLLIVEYKCNSDFIPKLKFESLYGDKAIILTKMNLINFVLLHNNIISIILLLLTLIIIIYYYIWYVFKQNK